MKRYLFVLTSGFMLSGCVITTGGTPPASPPPPPQVIGQVHGSSQASSIESKHQTSTTGAITPAAPVSSGSHSGAGSVAVTPAAPVATPVDSQQNRQVTPAAPVAAALQQTSVSNSAASAAPAEQRKTPLLINKGVISENVKKGRLVRPPIKLQQD